MYAQNDAVLPLMLAYFLVNKLAVTGHFTKKEIKSQLEKYRVVPDVVDKVPTEEIEVEYPGDVTIAMGNFVPLNQVMHPPEVKWNAQSNDYYSLTFVDADFINSLDFRKAEYQLWMVLNIPGNNITEGKLLKKYLGPKPSNAHAYHRYVFILWQHNFIDFLELQKGEQQLLTRREFFNTKNFTEKYEENGLGEPYAINFFRVCTPNEDEE